MTGASYESGNTYPSRAYYFIYDFQRGSLLISVVNSCYTCVYIIPDIMTGASCEEGNACPSRAFDFTDDFRYFVFRKCEESTMYVTLALLYDVFLKQICHYNYLITYLVPNKYVHPMEIWNCICSKAQHTIKFIYTHIYTDTEGVNLFYCLVLKFLIIKFQINFIFVWRITRYVFIV